MTTISLEKKKRIQDECSQILEQMRHCRQCRADAIGRLGNDLKYYIKWKHLW